MKESQQKDAFAPWALGTSERFTMLLELSALGWNRDVAIYQPPNTNSAAQLGYAGLSADCILRAEDIVQLIDLTYKRPQVESLAPE